jgi:hypothetical protein
VCLYVCNKDEYSHEDRICFVAAESEELPCTCPPHLHWAGSRPVWSPENHSDDVLQALVVQHEHASASVDSKPVDEHPPVQSTPTQPHRSALANYGAITIAGLPVSSSNEHAMVALHQAVGLAPEAASAHHKIEALRMFLENRLGLSTLITAHRAMSAKGCGMASDAEVDETVLSIVGFQNVDTVEVLDQLVQAERQAGEL